jgi:hypothetical protein
MAGLVLDQVLDPVTAQHIVGVITSAGAVSGKCRESLDQDVLGCFSFLVLFYRAENSIGDLAAIPSMVD